MTVSTIFCVIPFSHFYGIRAAAADDDWFLSHIASMSVKEVLQSLVDDNLVDTDKIGTSIYFWAYPSKALHTVSKLWGNYLRLPYSLMQGNWKWEMQNTCRKSLLSGLYWIQWHCINFLLRDNRNYSNSLSKYMNVKRKLPPPQNFWNKPIVAESSLWVLV